MASPKTGLDTSRTGRPPPLPARYDSLAMERCPIRPEAAVCFLTYPVLDWLPIFVSEKTCTPRAGDGGSSTPFVAAIAPPRSDPNRNLLREEGRERSMPVSCFNGKTAVESDHWTVPHHTLDFDPRAALPAGSGALGIMGPAARAAVPALIEVLRNPQLCSCRPS
jgi:hypothetical protein